ncbi:hypothetical protein [Kribbella sp. NPDC003557]|uniref:hypothetical protein n=1 Tax=Kribbella sp. NPDC003557 TaxID=3154449 RepID=UPI0033A09FF9
MTFESLPPTWPDRPLTDPTFTADVVDLMVNLGDRHRGTLTVLICDPTNHYQATVTIELPPEAIPSEATTPDATPSGATPSGATPSGGTPSGGTRSGAISSSAIRSDAIPPDAIPRGVTTPPDRWTRVAGTSPAQLCGTAMDPIIPAVRTAPGTALILALGRPGPARLTDLDTQWSQAATAICRAAGIRLLGFYVAAKDGVYRPATITPAAAA